MTFAELLAYPSNTPIRCADAAFGLLIRWDGEAQSAGVQVPGEEDIREIYAARLLDAGGGALVEEKP